MYYIPHPINPAAIDMMSASRPVITCPAVDTPPTVFGIKFSKANSLVSIVRDGTKWLSAERRL